MLALKVKFGLGANFLAVKKRNLNDITTFIDQETEVVNYLCQHLCLSENHKTNQEATKEDQMDLEGKCMRKKVIKDSILAKCQYPPIQVSYLTISRRTNGTSVVVVFESAVLKDETDSKSLACGYFLQVGQDVCPKHFLKTTDMASLKLDVTVLMPL